MIRMNIKDWELAFKTVGINIPILNTLVYIIDSVLNDDRFTSIEKQLVEIKAKLFKIMIIVIYGINYV